MVEAWVVIAIGAAFFQNLRSALQKHLKGKLSNDGAAYARFLYALPFAILYVWMLKTIGDKPLPAFNSTFLWYCLLGSVSQIIFTALLLWMFSFKSFAVGTTFSKLEVFTVALIGVIVLGDTLTPSAVFAIGICTAGVLALSIGQHGLSLTRALKNVGSRDTATGIACAIFLGASVVFFRGAALALQHHDIIMAAGFTLMIALIMQTLIMGAWISLRDASQFRRIIAEWRWAGAVGIAGVLASICWFTAFTLEKASYVRAVGQIELIFTYLFSVFIFKEKITRLETAGILLVAAGIICLLLFA